MSDGEDLVDCRVELVNNKIAELRERISKDKAYEVVVNSDGVKEINNAFNINEERKHLDSSLEYEIRDHFRFSKKYAFPPKSGEQIKEELLKAGKERKQKKGL